MAVLPLVVLPDPRLKQVSEPVGPIDEGVRTLVADMLDTMYAAPGIGLAAVQVGVLRRIAVVDVTPEPDEEEGGGEDAKAPARNPIVLIDPEIVWSSEEVRSHNEGCLSIPEYYEEVERPDRIRVRFRGLDGAEQELEADGLLATCIQHEVDHLDGVLFIDHLSRLKRERCIKKFAKAARHKAA